MKIVHQLLETWRDPKIEIIIVLIVGCGFIRSRLIGQRLGGAHDTPPGPIGVHMQDETAVRRIIPGLMRVLPDLVHLRPCLHHVVRVRTDAFSATRQVLTGGDLVPQHGGPGCVSPDAKGGIQRLGRIRAGVSYQLNHWPPLFRIHLLLLSPHQDGVFAPAEDRELVTGDTVPTRPVQ